MRNYRHIEVRPIAGALGAEIHGVDMSRDLEDDVVGEVRQAFLDHLVIFLRDQKATPHQQLAFARKFGEPIEYPQLKGLPESPMITPVVKLEHERNNFGGIWHSDTTYLADAADGQHAAGARGAALRRRHDVRQPVSRLRGAVGRAEGDARRADRRQLLDQGRRHQDARGPPEGGRRGAQGADRRASDRAHPSRDRPQGALHLEAPTPRTSRAGRRRRACRCWSSCGSTRRGRNSPAASAGRWARWRSGTIAAPCTIRSTTTTATAASCTASPWRATSRARAFALEMRSAALRAAPLGEEIR